MDPVRFSPGRAPYGSRILSARRQGAVPFLVQQGEGSHLAGRSHLGCRRENRAQSHTDLQPRSEGKGNQTRAHLYERVREEGECEVPLSRSGRLLSSCLPPSRSSTSNARSTHAAIRLTDTQRFATPPSAWLRASSFRWWGLPDAARRRCSTSPPACSSLRPAR